MYKSFNKDVVINMFSKTLTTKHSKKKFETTVGFLTQRVISSVRPEVVITRKFTVKILCIFDKIKQNNKKNYH